MWRVLLLLMLVGVGFSSGVHAEVIAYWNYNSPSPDNDATTGTIQPAIGGGAASLLGGVSATFTASNGSSDTATDNSNWRITTWPAQGTANKTRGIQFTASTSGFRRLRLHFDLRNSNTASKYVRLQYTTNGTVYLDHVVITMPAESWFNEQFIALDTVPGVENNPLFGLRFVTEFQSTATGAGPANYVPANSGSTYGSAGTLRFDMIVLSGDPIVPAADRTVRLVNYNVQGADAVDWTTNSPQVQAIGRQLSFLTPDVVTLQEIPDMGLPHMPGFLATYLPGFHAATNRVGDGNMGNLILSRFPILRSRSHLGRSSLVAWGYAGVFTRDLFEAEIAVPGWNEPLHAFAVHLKAFNDAESAPRRAAEASAISNFFVTVFQPVHGDRPHVLAGDFNEDIARPRSYEQGAMHRLINPATGLNLTTPRNPVTADERTWSSRNPTPTIRFDYHLPNPLLLGNLITNWIFRTDMVNPLPPGLGAADSQVASDHLPVVAVYGNPYRVAAPVKVTLRIEARQVRLDWETTPGHQYTVRGSWNLTNWFDLSPALPANNTNLSWTGSLVSSGMFFRVRETR